MIAALPMYDRPEAQAANDAFWQAIRARLGRGPETLDRTRGLQEVWCAGDLLLSQTCNLPWRLGLQGRAQLVGCPDYGLDDCPPGYYNSVLVARRDDPRDLDSLLAARVVINQGHSQSGYGALWALAAARGATPNITAESGGHIASARMVARGEADLACIDAHSLRGIRAFDPDAAELRAVATTAASPATPYITGPREDPAGIRAAMRAALGDLPPATRAALGLRDVVEMPAAAILSLPTPPAR
ncbi:phosphate/phosphite/phosphonate ABC transporter substrate-binding protein [Salipiger sp.]|uniref:phosphate/phosphite/phosphonate ABC transporter substrate-binding protein n=1 Tax=Salipiger sp. TaxID=2078585 RepID=UPI003A973471